MGFFDFIFNRRREEPASPRNATKVATPPTSKPIAPKPSPDAKAAYNQSADSRAAQNDRPAVRWSKPVTVQTLFKKSVSFHVERFEQWQQGRCTASGPIEFDIHLIADSNRISVTIPFASRFRMHEAVSFDFLGSQVLEDRVQYVNAPGASQDPTRPIILHIFAKNGKIDYIRFAMSFPDRIVEFYGYQIESETSRPSDFQEMASTGTEPYKLASLSSLLAVAACDGEISEIEMRAIFRFMIREGLNEKDLAQVINAPDSVPNKIPVAPALRAQHLRDIIAVAMADGNLNTAEYRLCRQIATMLGFRPEAIDYILKEFNDQSDLPF